MVQPGHGRDQRGPRHRTSGGGHPRRRSPPANENLRRDVGEDFARSASLSPNGQRIVFTGADQTSGRSRVYIRQVDSDEVTAIEGSEYGTEPFWSPDSEGVGFYTNGKLMISRLGGGAPQAIADASSTRGAS